MASNCSAPRTVTVTLPQSVLLRFEYGDRASVFRVGVDRKQLRRVAYLAIAIDALQGVAGSQPSADLDGLGPLLRKRYLDVVATRRQVHQGPARRQLRVGPFLGGVGRTLVEGDPAFASVDKDTRCADRDPFGRVVEHDLELPPSRRVRNGCVADEEQHFFLGLWGQLSGRQRVERRLIVEDDVTRLRDVPAACCCYRPKLAGLGSYLQHENLVVLKRHGDGVAEGDRREGLAVRIDHVDVVLLCTLAEAERWADRQRERVPGNERVSQGNDGASFTVAVAVAVGLPLLRITPQQVEVGVQFLVGLRPERYASQELQSASGTLQHLEVGNHDVVGYRSTSR
jgi:hypothetical protein